jgi:type VI secretion system protein ImpM
MMSDGLATPATCFGKLPTRGDFVKGPNQHQLISMLDRWISSGMESLSEDPRWKIAYDMAPAVDFAFVGARSRISVIGHLKPSQDASGRRFPFLTVATVERDDQLMLRCAPAGLSRPFGVLRNAAQAGLDGAEVGSILTDLGDLNTGSDFSLALQADPLGHFVRRTTVSALNEMIAPQDSVEVTRRIILAIGLLMRPILGNASITIDKEIVMPLPTDDRYRNLVAGLWLYLISAFIRNTGLELQVLIAPWGRYARMVIGFNGASPRTLLAVMSPHSVPDSVIDLHDPEWIEDHGDLVHDYGVAKLSSYLSQPAITLEAAVNTFREVFLGE